MEGEEAAKDQERADKLRKKGNTAFKKQRFQEANDYFTEAINLDPDNHILYSNRSGARASLGEWETALADADKVIDLKPDWAKAYSRKAVACYGLKDYDQAIELYKMALKLEPTNEAIKECLAQSEQSKKEEMEREKREAEYRKKEQEELAARPKEEILSEFMKEIKETAAADSQWTTEIQLDRILQRHHNFINLNPYEVLALPPTATLKEIQKQFRKLSILVHPDRVSDPRAKDASMELQKAYETLQDPDEKERIDKYVQAAIQVFEKEQRDRKLQGLPLEDPYEGQQKVSRRIFAQATREKELRERREASQKQREADKKESAKESVKRVEEHEKEWEQTRDKRIGSWREFVTNPSKKARTEVRPPKLKEEERKSDGTGVQLKKDEYKKKWR